MSALSLAVLDFTEAHNKKKARSQQGPVRSQAEIRREYAFNKLVITYSTDLKRYAYWLCHDASVADDLVQETMLRAWRALEQLRDAKSAKGWLFTTLRRENARRFERYQPDFSDIELDTLNGGEIGCDAEKDTHALHQAMDLLPENYRKPLVLQVVGGYGYDEISKLLGLSQSAVTSRLFRARQKLQELFEDAQMNGELAL